MKYSPRRPVLTAPRRPIHYRVSKLRAAVALAAAVLLCWAAARGPGPQRTVSTLEREAPLDPARAAIPSPAAAVELAPPEPVLQQSAQRRFSSPASNGAAGGFAGASEEDIGTTRAGERRYAGSASAAMPGGYGAPSASVGTFASAPGTAGPPGRAPNAPDRGAPGKQAGTERGSDPGDGPAGDKQLTGAAAGLVGAARELKTRGDAAAMRAASSSQAGIMRQLDVDRKVDEGIRKGISDIQSSGKPVTPEAVAKISEGVMIENGLDPANEDLGIAAARAMGPRPPDIPPAAYAAAVQEIVNSPPLDPTVRAELERLADKPPPPRSPPPRGALDAFRKHGDVFDKALDDFGVKPEHILGILGVETRWGQNTGKFPLPATLLAISQRTDREGRPTKAAVQAGKDLAALARLSASNNLGGLTPNQVHGSYAGAMGVPQFLPTSWEAYSRAPDGGKRDPFNFGTAAYSVGNYLKVHGYSRDVPRSIWGYNHSQEYVDKVLGLSADVKAGLPKDPPK